MAKNNRLDELRAIVRQQQQAATRKVRRNENKGIDLEGTKHDVRRNPSNISKYNTKQLQSYLSQLNGFMSRKTQFVPDTYGRAIPIARWRTYQRAERASNRVATNLDAQFSNIFIPSSGMTVAQRNAATRSEFPRTANPAVNSPFRKISRIPQQIASQKALENLTKQQQLKVKPEFMDNFVAEGRKQLDQMLKVMNDTGMQDRIKNLTDKQFHILWAYTGFADAIVPIYNEALAMSGGEETKRWQSEVSYRNTAEVEELVDWIGKIK